MFDMRLLCLVWSAACLGVTGALLRDEADARPRALDEPALPLAAAAVALTPQADGQIVVPRASDGLFYLTGRVNGRRIRFLIDTGSSYIVLTSHDAAGASIAPGGNTAAMPVRTAGGLVEMAMVDLPPFEVAGRRMTGIQAVIADTAGVSLLGQNALAQFGSITLGPDTITIHPAAEARNS